MMARRRRAGGGDDRCRWAGDRPGRRAASADPDPAADQPAPSGCSGSPAARALMKRNGIGAVLVESGPSLDYFTGIQWWRSERLTGVVIPAEGDPIIVTPFFEKADASPRCSASRPKSAPGRRMRSR